MKGIARTQLGEVPEDQLAGAVAFTDRLCDGVAAMWESWQRSAQMVGVEVNSERVISRTLPPSPPRAP